MNNRDVLLRQYQDVKRLLEQARAVQSENPPEHSSTNPRYNLLEITLKKIKSLQNAEHCLTRKKALKELCYLVSKYVIQDNVEREENNKQQATNKEERPNNTETTDLPKRRTAIESTIVAPGKLKFTDVAGLPEAKRLLREAVVMPLKYPHLFVGPIKPWRRILLFGPPGTGKSRIAKAVSSEVESTFYSVASSDLLSSWFGESEKLIKELFRNARDNPGRSVIFIDEIDGLCRKRNSNEQEQTRRIKTELLKQMEGVDSHEEKESKLFVLGATNCPWELDTAFLRRFEKRIYIPLPDKQARRELFHIHLNSFPLCLTAEELEKVVEKSEGYSGSDISTCIADALFEPIRELEKSLFWKWNSDGKTVSPCQELEIGAVKIRFDSIPTEQVKPRSVACKDIEYALDKNHSTINFNDLKEYEKFTSSFGH